MSGVPAADHSNMIKDGCKMTNYRITVNGNTYDVVVEEIGGTPGAMTVSQIVTAPPTAPATAPAVVPAAATATAPAPDPAKAKRPSKSARERARRPLLSSERAGM